MKFDPIVSTAAALLGLLAGLLLAVVFLSTVADRHENRIRALEDWRAA